MGSITPWGNVTVDPTITAVLFVIALFTELIAALKFSSTGVRFKAPFSGLFAVRVAGITCCLTNPPY